MRKKTLAIVPAAGEGKRMAAGKPKQYLELAGRPILAHTTKILNDSPAIDEIFLVVSPSDANSAASFLPDFAKVSKIVFGGATRQDSTRNAVFAARAEHEIILIHDAVRPFVTLELIERVVEAARRQGAAIAAVAVQETVKRRLRDQRLRTISREELWLAQTPQAFRRDLILQAHREALGSGRQATDDAGLVEKLGVTVALVPGLPTNIKITTPQDLLWAEELITLQKWRGR